MKYIMSSVMAFDRPGGEIAAQPRKSIPLNIAHLSRQTMGDRRLEEEVLALFAQQASLLQGQLARADAKERKKLAHTLKGAAAAVGAERVAEHAEAVMVDPLDAASLRKLSAALDEARAFIARFTR